MLINYSTFNSGAAPTAIMCGSFARGALDPIATINCSNTTIFGVGNGEYINISFSLTGPSTANTSVDQYTFNVSTIDNSSAMVVTLFGIKVTDNDAPTWATNASSIPATYSSSTKSAFNVTWTDNVGISTVVFESNYSGTTRNYTTFSFGGGIYSYNETLPAVTFQWRMFANDSAANANVTDAVIASIGLATPAMTIIVTPTNSTTYPVITTATGTVTTGDPGANTALYRNGTIVGASTQTIGLGVAPYNYSFAYNGSANFTGGFVQNITIVAQNTTTATWFNLTLNSTEANLTGQTYLAVTLANGNSSSVFTGQTITFTLYRDDNTSLGTTNPVNETIALGAGTHIYTYNTSGNANYSAASKTLNVTISRGTPSLALIITPTNSTTYPVITTATGTVVTGDLSPPTALYRNGTVVAASTETVGLGVAPYNYSFAYNGTANYTALTITNITNVAQNTTTATWFNLTLNGTEANLSTQTYPAVVLANGNSSSVFTGQTITFTLYRDNAVSLGTTNPVNETNTLSATTHYYTYNTSGNANYSAASKTFNITINRGTPSVRLVITPANSTTYPVITTATGSVITGDASPATALYRNNSIVHASTETIGLGVAPYNYTFAYNQSENYTVVHVTNITVVAQNTSTSSFFNLTLNGTEANLTGQTYPAPVIANANYSLQVFTGQAITFTLFRDSNTSLGTGNPVNETNILSAGTHLYTYNTTGNANYSSSSKTFNVSISKATPSLRLTITPGNSTTFPVITTATGTAVTGDPGAATALYRNGTIAHASTETIGLGAAPYNYSFAYNGTENYTGSYLYNITVVAQNASTLNFMRLLMNGTDADLSGQYPVASNATGHLNSTAFTGQTLTFTLYRNGSSIGTTDPISQVIGLAAGTYGYVYNTSGNANYSAATINKTLTITKAPTLTQLFLNGSQANTAYAPTAPVNWTVTVNVSGKTARINSNMTGFVEQTGTTPLFNLTTLPTVTNATFNVTGWFAEDENYTTSNVTYYATVGDNSVPSILSVSANPAEANPSSISVISWKTIDNVGVTNVTVLLGSEVLLTGAPANSSYNWIVPAPTSTTIYAITLIVKDAAGNSVNTPVSVQVRAISTSGGGSSGGGGGSSTATTEGTAHLNDQPTEHTASLAQGSGATYFVGGDLHTVTVASITAESVTLTIASTPFNITLGVGETKDVDMTGDGNNDLSIRLNSITDGKASLAFTKLPQPAAPAPQQPAPAQQPSSSATPETQAQPEQATPLGGASLFFVAGLAVLVGGWFLWRQRSGKGWSNR